jgi:hypothetical protein
VPSWRAFAAFAAFAAIAPPLLLKARSRLRREGPGKLHLVEDPGEAVAHGPEAPGPVDLRLKAAEGQAQDLAPDFPVDLGFPLRKEGGGGSHPLFSQTRYRSRKVGPVPPQVTRLTGVFHDDQHLYSLAGFIRIRGEQTWTCGSHYIIPGFTKELGPVPLSGSEWNGEGPLERFDHRVPR